MGLAAWMVDAPRLRAMLDALRTALAATVTPPGVIAETLLYDHKQLADTLLLVLEGLERGELRRRFGAPQAPRGVEDPGLSKLLDVIVRDLRRAWHERTVTALGHERLAVLRRFLALPAPDWLGVLGRSNDENSHSAVLCWLLSPRTAPSIAPYALNAIVTQFDDPEEWKGALAVALKADALSVRREYVFGREWVGSNDLDRIDIVITAPQFTIAIENKTSASEHCAQTQTYWQWLQSLRGLRGGIFLTPTGTGASCSAFRATSYLTLLRLLLEAPTRGRIGETEELVLAGYVKTLAASVLRTELRLAREGEMR